MGSLNVPNARGNPSTMRSPVPDVNRTSISWRHDIFGWSMRPWDSVPAVRGAARRTPRVAWTIPIRTQHGQWSPRGYQTALSAVRGARSWSRRGGQGSGSRGAASFKTLKSLSARIAWARPQRGPRGQKLQPTRGQGSGSRGAASLRPLEALAPDHLGPNLIRGSGMNGTSESQFRASRAAAARSAAGTRGRALRDPPR
jgi:hypothetical protein